MRRRDCAAERRRWLIYRERGEIVTTETISPYRPGIEPVPHRMKGRPIARGYPVPWFCPQLPDGTWEFRAAEGGKFQYAIRYGVCWLCGRPLGSHKAFVIGPMCAVNRTTSEPPCHTDCAEWAVKVCPFLTQRQAERREGNKPAGWTPPAGEMIARQPGVALLWQTKHFNLFSDGQGGVLIRIGDPERVTWWREARPATRAEVLESLDSGLPFLMERAIEDGRAAVAELTQRRAAVDVLLPRE